MITKEMIIGDILKAHPELEDIFTEFGMHCLSCPCARAESIEQACDVHDIDADELVDALNDAIEE